MEGHSTDHIGLQVKLLVFHRNCVLSYRPDEITNVAYPSTFGVPIESDSFKDWKFM